jgi:hypothetical protein
MSLSSRARDLMLATSLLACESNDSKGPGITPPNDSDTPTIIDTDRPDTDRPDTDTQETDVPVVVDPGEIQGLQEMGLSLVRRALPSDLIPRDSTAPPGAAENWWNETWTLLPDGNILATGFLNPAVCGDNVPILDPSARTTVACLEEEINYQGVIFIASGENAAGDDFVVFQGMAGRGPEIGIFRKNEAGNYVETGLVDGDRTTRGIFFRSGLPNMDGLILRSQFGRSEPYQLCGFSIDDAGRMAVQSPCLLNNIEADDPPYTFRSFGDTLWILRGGDRRTELTEMVRLDVNGDTVTATPLTGIIPDDQGLYDDLQPGEIQQFGLFAPMGFVCFDNQIQGTFRTFYEGVISVASGAIDLGPHCVIGTTREADPAFAMPNFPNPEGMADYSWQIGLPGGLMSWRWANIDGGAYVREWDSAAIPFITLDEEGQVRIPHMVIKTGGDDGGTTRGALDLLQGLPPTQSHLDVADMGLFIYTQALKDGYYPNHADTPVGKPNPGIGYDPDDIFAGQFYSAYNLDRSTEGFANDIQMTNPRTITWTVDGGLAVGTEANLPYPGREAPPAIFDWKRENEDACRVWTVLLQDDLTESVDIDTIALDGTHHTVTVILTNGGKQVHHGKNNRGQFFTCEGIVPANNPGLDIREAVYAQ